MRTPNTRNYLVSVGLTVQPFKSRASLSAAVPAFKEMPIGGSLTFNIRTEPGIEHVDRSRTLDEMVKRLQGKAEIVREIHDTPDGMREFAMCGCNGYVLVFAEKIGRDNRLINRFINSRYAG